MNQASNPALAAAVSNAGGLGVIGGVGYTPKMLREMIQELKSFLRDPQLPWGIDLLLPAIGGSARKTNKDYTKGSLMELIDIIVEEKATLFVSAVGVPPKEVIDKLHNAGIICANMVGHEKHALKAIEAGTDIIIAQGGEGERISIILEGVCTDMLLELAHSWRTYWKHSFLCIDPNCSRRRSRSQIEDDWKANRSSSSRRHL
jgi:hypothetical protein